MTGTMATSNTVELRDSSVEGDELSSYAGYHALVPILIGLSIPLSLYVLAVPDAIKDSRFAVMMLLVLITVVTGAIFLISILRPGATMTVRFDGNRRVAEIVRSGTFAHSVYTVPFARIQSVRIETRYDDDGYGVMQPVMILKPREAVELPPTTTPADVARIRELIGLA